MGRGKRTVVTAAAQRAPSRPTAKRYRLLGADGPYLSKTPGTLGGHRRNKIYGRLDCPSALKWLEAGYYVKERVFFADEEAALDAGYRPCGCCLPDKYRAWRAGEDPRLVEGGEPRRPLPVRVPERAQAAKWEK